MHCFRGVSDSESILILITILTESYPCNAGLFGPAASNFRTEVEAFDPVSQAWTSLAPLLYARGDNAFVTLPGDRLFVMGGETGDANDNRTSVSVTHGNLRVVKGLPMHGVGLSPVTLSRRWSGP